MPRKMAVKSDIDYRVSSRMIGGKRLPFNGDKISEEARFHAQAGCEEEAKSSRQGYRQGSEKAQRQKERQEEVT